MLQKFQNAIYKIKCRWGLILTFIFYFIISTGIINKDDDLVFMNAFEQFGGIASFIKFYYNHWSGRIIPHTLLVLMLNLWQIIFFIVNALLMTLLVWAVIRLCTADSGLYFNKTEHTSNAEINIITVAFAAALIFLPGHEMLNRTVLWKCAAVLYVWCSACAVSAVYPLIARMYKKECKVRELIILVPASVYACSFEQTAMFMAAFMLIIAAVNFIKYKSLTVTEIVLLIVTLIMTAVTILVPGNWERYSLEIIMDISCYDMYTIIDRIVFAISYMLGGIRDYFCIFLMLISASVFAMVYRHHKSWIYRLISAVPVLYYILACVYKVLNNYYGDSKTAKFLGHYFFNYIDVGAEQFEISYGQWFSMFIGLLCICIVVIMLLAGISYEREWLASVMFAAAICESVMIGSSPSVNTSGIRGLFMTFLFLLITVLRIFVLLYRETLEQIKNSHI